MNDATEPSTINDRPSSAGPPALAPRSIARDVFLWIAIAVVLILVGLLAWRSTSDLNRTQREYARRIAETEARAVQTSQAAQDAANTVIDLRSKIAVIEARLAESQSQQYALEQLYQELSRNRDEAQLADIEQIVSAAAQQLQLLGNVQGAIITLQSVDARLARVDKPQFLGVRRAIGRDLDRLKTLPSADISGIAVKLDQLVAQVDTLPTLIDATPPSVAVAPAAPAAPGRNPKPAPKGVVPAPAPNASASVPPSAFEQWWDRTVERFAGQARDLLRIREVGSPDALLLAPSQAYFLRENLKLRLLNARLQLLSRNEGGFHTDVVAAAEWVERYFDPQNKSTATFRQTLKTLQSAPVTVELPSLSESLSAVRNFRPGGGVLSPSRAPSGGGTPVAPAVKPAALNR